jgi:hypothetical protein
MAQAFRSIPHQKNAYGAGRGSLCKRCHQCAAFARGWIVTIVLVSVLVVLSTMEHWSL